MAAWRRENGLATEPIDDEFAGRFDARTRWKMRQQVRGRCRACNEPALPDSCLCEVHRMRARAIAQTHYAAQRDEYHAQYGMSKWRAQKYIAQGMTVAQMRQAELIQKLWRGLTAYRKREYKRQGIAKADAVRMEVIG